MRRREAAVLSIEGALAGILPRMVIALAIVLLASPASAQDAARVVLVAPRRPSSVSAEDWAEQHPLAAIRCEGARPRCVLDLVLVMPAPVEDGLRGATITISREDRGAPPRVAPTRVPPIATGDRAVAFQTVLQRVDPSARYTLMVRRRGDVIAQATFGIAWAEPLPAVPCVGYTASRARACERRGCTLQAPSPCPGGAFVSAEEHQRRLREEARMQCECVCRQCPRDLP